MPSERRGWTPEQYVQECFDAGVPDGFRGTLVSMVAEAQHEARQELRRDLVDQYERMSQEVDNKLPPDGNSIEWQEAFNIGVTASLLGLSRMLQKRIERLDGELP